MALHLTTACAPPRTLCSVCEIQIPTATPLLWHLAAISDVALTGTAEAPLASFSRRGSNRPTEPCVLSEKVTTAVFRNEELLRSIRHHTPLSIRSETRVGFVPRLYVPERLVPSNLHLHPAPWSAPTISNSKVLHKMPHEQAEICIHYPAHLTLHVCYRTA